MADRRRELLRPEGDVAQRCHPRCGADETCHHQLWQLHPDGINALTRKKKEEPTAPPAPSNEEKLLTEIRDLLKEQK